MAERVTDSPRLISVFDGQMCINPGSSNSKVLYVLCEGVDISYWVVDQQMTNDGKFRMRETDESGKPTRKFKDIPASQQIFNNLLVVDSDGLRRQFWGKDRSIDGGQPFKLMNLVEGRSERDMRDGLPDRDGRAVIYECYKVDEGVRF